ncbi:hypothetical protein V2J09_018309, partial [Rumex salicifolius]
VVDFSLSEEERQPEVDTYCRQRLLIGGYDFFCVVDQREVPEITDKIRNMIRRERAKGAGSPKVGVGEIDTSAPFHSVKDAVNLFGEVAFSGEKPAIKQVKPHSAERIFAKETQLHIAEKELNKLKAQLKYAENTKAEALVELEKAKKSASDLTKKLETINEIKEAALRVSESAKVQLKQHEEANIGSAPVNKVSQQQDLECATAQYVNALAELNAAKQELTKVRQDYDASLEAKTSVFKKVEEAKLAAKANSERAHEVSKEILDAKEAIEQLRQATTEAKEDLAKVFADKSVERQTYKANLEESEMKLQALKRGLNPELGRNLEAQLSETMSEIHTLQKEMENAKASDMETLRTVTSELDGAKDSLQKVLQEEISLQQLVESLKCDLENLRKEHNELRKKEAETESLAGNLHVKLRKSKSELENYLVEETKAIGASDGMIATLHQLSSETRNAHTEAEELKIKAGELEKEAQAMKASLEEAEKLLRITLEESKQAKSAEESALEQIKALSERTNTARSSTSESGAKITLSREEFESLSRKAEESDKLAELKVAAALAQVEAVKASECEGLKRLGAAQKEKEDIEIATMEAMKAAERAEAAKKAVEGELRKWREREQKKIAEAASRILAEAQPSEVSTEEKINTETVHVTHQATTKYSSPSHYKIQKQRSEISAPTKKVEKQRSLLSNKAAVPNLGGLFHRKKSQIEAGTPSYLPGESLI